MMSDKLELMLPVGSWESLVAARQGGADSVYFGVQGLNMRSASSVNFSLDDLSRIVEYCRVEGLKSYLTLNTVIYDADLEYMREVLARASAERISAVIVSDQAAMIEARRQGLAVHISTQLNISNIEALRFYSQWADVVVLARELELPAVRRIYDAIQIENICGPSGERVRIEMFAHGALCMAVSGKCYLSLHEAWKSANRGECRQICRRRYDVRDVETGGEVHIDNQYIMSPKDLCTIDFVDLMLEAGVRVFKIEGRARDGGYVRLVASAYRRALDSSLAGAYTAELADSLKGELLRVFNRGFWGGYYAGHRLGEWTDSYGSSASERKVYAGKVTNFFSKISVVELLLEADGLASGDKLLVLGATTGAVEIVCPDIFVDQKAESSVAKGALASIKVAQMLRRGDKVYRLVSNN